MNSSAATKTVAPLYEPRCCVRPSAFFARDRLRNCFATAQLVYSPHGPPGGQCEANTWLLANALLGGTTKPRRNKTVGRREALPSSKRVLPRKARH